MTLRDTDPVSDCVHCGEKSLIPVSDCSVRMEEEHATRALLPTSGFVPLLSPARTTASCPVRGRSAVSCARVGVGICLLP